MTHNQVFGIVIEIYVILGILTLSGSGGFLKYNLRYPISVSKCLTPFLFGLLGIAVSTQLRNFSEATLFLVAAMFQFTFFIFVSRFRQRSSFFWHTIASLASNGTWYFTMGILSSAKAYWMLFIPHVIAIIAGRTTGVNWAQYIETRYTLKANVANDKNLEPGKRFAYIKKERILHVLIFIIVVYAIYGATLPKETFVSIIIVMGLGILQNLLYSLNTRASARSNNWNIAITGIFSGIVFYVSMAYIFARKMPLELFIPYTISTALGSTIGAFFSMILEYQTKSSPDKHLDTSQKTKAESTKIPYLIMLALSIIWIFFNEPIMTKLGYNINPLHFPISTVTTELPRALVMFTASLIFFFDEAFHSMNSRAGNRSHSGYHVVTCVPKGIADFLKISYISLNSRIPDILPIGILVGCLGNLLGKDISKKIESWLQARMDVQA